ncbi:MAG: S1 RNA-binding domain-containing protein, partial [Nitrospirales bacterium]
MSTMSDPIEEIDETTLAAMYDETFRNFEEGTITQGRVVAIQKDRVIVDIGYKSEGMIPMNQFLPDELPTLAEGD